MEVKLGKCLCGDPERMEQDENGKPVLVRCPLYQSLKVQTAPGVWEDEWKCSIAWTPILLIENRNAMDACAKYTESFRNEVIARIDDARAARSSVAERFAAAEQAMTLVQEAPDAPAQ